MEDNMEVMEQKSVVVSYFFRMLFILFLLYTVIALVGMEMEYSFVLYHGCLQSIIIAALLLVAVIVAFWRKITLNNKEQIVITLLLPLTIGFQFYLTIMYFGHHGYIQVILCALSGGVSIVSMICLFFRYRLYTTLKIIVGVISAICMVIWLLISGVMSCVSLARLCGFGEFGKTSVVKEVISPEQQTQQRQKNYTTGRMTNCSIYDTLINNLKPMIYQIRIRNYLNNVSCIVL